MSDYQKEYKKRYKQNNKIVSFPLSNIFYEELRRKSLYYDLSVNAYVKHIVTNSLNANNTLPLTSDRVKQIQEYIHISRGIANNINQFVKSSI